MNNTQIDTTEIQLSPIGEFPHEHGVQTVDRKTVRNLASNFKSLHKRVIRYFVESRKIPVFIGHPDDPHFRGKHGHLDKQVYGYVREMKIKDSGLWVTIDWTKEGKSLIEYGFYRYLSPRWEMESVDSIKFRPTKIISIGLTNTPNIPNEPIVAKHPIARHAKTHLSKMYLRNQSIQNFVSRVNQRMRTTGEDYLTAWSYVKSEDPTGFYFQNPSNN